MSSVYAIVTQRILKLLEQGIVPWHKQWSSPNGFPRNLTTLKAYRGCNVWILGAQKYEHSLWATYKQIQVLGGHVRSGQRASPVVFWSMLDGEDAQGKEKKIPLLRYYSVFNVAQCEGIPEKHIPKFPPLNPNYKPLDGAVRIVEGMPKRPPIEHGHGQAAYYPTLDTVRMPDPQRFESAESYHSVLFHELIHSTGHKSRIGRDGITNGAATFGSATYGKEELVAEMGAAFLCGQCGIEGGTVENSAAYLDGWIRAIKGDARLIVTAAAAAQKAADFILNQNISDENGGAA